MSWFPVDDALHSHPKARKAGLEAMGLWTVSGSFCMAYLTDGFISEWWVRQQPRGMVLAKRLIEAGLWKPAKNAGEDGFQFHDWKPECTKAHVLEAREKARQRKAKSRLSQGESRVTGHVTHASRHACVPSTTQPNPTQPINTVVDLGGEVTQVGPSIYCPSHPSGTQAACGGCKKARMEREAWEVAQQQNELSDRRKAREQRESCPLCDENGMREVRGGLTRCDHRETVNA
jgi:hypothetical protein